MRDLHNFITKQGFTVKYEQIKSSDDFADEIQQRLHKLNHEIEPPVLRNHVQLITTAQVNFNAE